MCSLKVSLSRLSPEASLEPVSLPFSEEDCPFLARPPGHWFSEFGEVLSFSEASSRLYAHSMLLQMQPSFCSLISLILLIIINCQTCHHPANSPTADPTTLETLPPHSLNAIQNEIATNIAFLIQSSFYKYSYLAGKTSSNENKVSFEQFFRTELAFAPSPRPAADSPQNGLVGCWFCSNIIAMSKPNIKFIYTGQFRSEVQQLQKGPAKLENLYGSIIHPEYMPITLEDQQPQVVSTVEVNSKPTSPNSNSLFRYKSAENIRVQEEPRSSNASNTLNIEEVGESEMVARKQANSKKPKIPQQPDQIVLNAPSYKFVPRKEGEIAVHSRKEYKKHTSVEKCLTSESTLRSRRQTNKNINNEPQLKSSNPFLKIESVDERDFKTEPSEQQQSSENSSVPPSFDERIVLKAPKYKYVPQPEGELAVNNRKKEYVKSQKTAEKYFYGGVQSRQESDFISCFGCIKPTGRTYQAQDD